MDDTFLLSPWNHRLAPMVKVRGLLDGPEGPLVFLECGHSLPLEMTNDLPLVGNEVPCWRCREDPPIVPQGMAS